MTSSVERLAAHVETMKSNIDPSTVSRLMSLSRQLIEETKTKDRYPVLNLFCDWSLHPKLDRKDAQNVLGRLKRLCRWRWRSQVTLPPTHSWQRSHRGGFETK
jgi:hypothetical protein